MEADRGEVLSIQVAQLETDAPEDQPGDGNREDDARRVSRGPANGQGAACSGSVLRPANLPRASNASTTADATSEMSRLRRTVGAP